MIEFKLANKEDINQISDFIAEINKVEESNIGFCGIDNNEIFHSLIEDITDIPFYKSFIIAYQNEKIIGVLGFDTDFSSNNVEVWGPFIKESKWNIVYDMWGKMIERLADEIELISMFINKKNKRCLSLVENLNFNKKSEEIIFNFERRNISKLLGIPNIELSPIYYQDMESLHDKVFPKTYYTGKEIIERLNNYRKVFINTENNDLAGYIYTEVNPRFGEGSIEFFAVEETQRGKGIGNKLLSMALKWLFTFEGVNDITLCVNSENKKAVELYKRIGFKQTNQLCYFTKSIKNNEKM
ncbi:GNAT family N-acetyltransferase [Clostridium sp. D2Q-11]|uniref:GNAT family N-acetyltransferase n=1 Tax=Anaeromonas frigoriresistens TaxID=2683708 RepID=A0A942UVL6_9FIRM|nr:GNAT family N-acetyltransferase [Anaeromonas frigoriresistens]MBS4537716.1 GNAT family N-acetyltransferase [Anaeromonas frigoriresistens]